MLGALGGNLRNIHSLLNNSLHGPHVRTPTILHLIAFVTQPLSLLLHCSTATQTLRWIWFVYRFQSFASCTAWPLLLFVPRLIILLSFELDWYILHYCIVSLLLASSTLFFWSTLLPSFSLTCASFTKMRILSSLPLWSLSFHCSKYFILSSCSCRTPRPTEVLHDAP